MISIEFTVEELNALAALLDLSVKAAPSSLKAAKVALPLMTKLEESVAAFNAKLETKETAADAAKVAGE